MTGDSPPLHPRRSLGQNFLRDKNIARKIIGAIDPKPDDIIIEIGPGEGALSDLLAGNVFRFFAVEVDPRAVSLLREKLSALEGVEIVQADFLSFDLLGVSRTHERRVRVVGNIPYNITSPILFHILDHRTCVQDATLMLQKEVVDRVVATPGSKAYGIPSVLFQCFADVRRLFDVSANVFHPKPSVTSSVMKVIPLPRPRFDLRDEQLFRSMVRAVFGKRRKTLRNSLRYFLGEDAALPDLPDLGRRPEELSVEELAELSNMLVPGNRAGIT